MSALRMPVLPPTMVVIQKLRALKRHFDFAKLLPTVRAIRERLDRDRIKAQTADNDTRSLAARVGLTA